MSELIGYSNYLKERLDRETNRLYLFDDLIAERNAIIAHRFSKHTVQPYSLTLLKEQIKRGVRLIEFDVENTNDTDPNDRIFYLSHSDMEEIAPEDRPSPITKDNFNKALINLNNQALNRGDTLPSLREAWDALKTENVLIFMEAKTTDINGLLAECQAIGLTPEKMIFQDFDNAQLDIFKNAGYKTMKIKNSALTTQEKEDYDYFCCNVATIDTFQSDSGIDKFFYYTSDSPAEWTLRKNAKSKLVGCFSDCALPTFKQLAVEDKSLLDPVNGHVSVINVNQNLSKNTSVKMDETGNVIIDFNPQGNYAFGAGDVDTIVSFHSYLVKKNTYHTFRISELENSGNSADWISIILRYGGDYLEVDSTSGQFHQYQGINLLFRDNNQCQLYILNNGQAYLKKTYVRDPAEEYLTLKWDISGSNVGTIVNFNTTPDAIFSENVSLNYFEAISNFPDFDFPTNEHVFLTIKRDDTCNAKVEYYQRRFEKFKVP